MQRLKTDKSFYKVQSGLFYALNPWELNALCYMWNKTRENTGLDRRPKVIERP